VIQPELGGSQSGEDHGSDHVSKWFELVATEMGLGSAPLLGTAKLIPLLFLSHVSTISNSV